MDAGADSEYASRGDRALADRVLASVKTHSGTPAPAPAPIPAESDAEYVRVATAAGGYDSEYAVRGGETKRAAAATDTDSEFSGAAKRKPRVAPAGAATATFIPADTMRLVADAEKLEAASLVKASGAYGADAGLIVDEERFREFFGATDRDTFRRRDVVAEKRGDYALFHAQREIAQRATDRMNPIVRFVNLVHAFTSGATKSVGHAAVGSTPESAQHGYFGVRAGRVNVAYDEKASVAHMQQQAMPHAGTAVEAMASGGDAYGTEGAEALPPWMLARDVTGIMQIDDTVFGAMQDIAMQLLVMNAATARRFRGATMDNFVLDNMYIQVMFAKLVGLSIKFGLLTDGYFANSRTILPVNVRDRALVMRELARKARYDAARGRLVLLTDRGHATTMGDFDKTEETGTQWHGGLPPVPGGAINAPAQGKKLWARTRQAATPRTVLRGMVRDVALPPGDL